MIISHGYLVEMADRAVAGRPIEITWSGRGNDWELVARETGTTTNYVYRMLPRYASPEAAGAAMRELVASLMADRTARGAHRIAAQVRPAEPPGTPLGCVYCGAVPGDLHADDCFTLLATKPCTDADMPGAVARAYLRGTAVDVAANALSWRAWMDGFHVTAREHRREHVRELQRTIPYGTSIVRTEKIMHEMLVELSQNFAQPHGTPIVPRDEALQAGLDTLERMWDGEPSRREMDALRGIEAARRHAEQQRSAPRSCSKCPRPAPHWSVTRPDLCREHLAEYGRRLSEPPRDADPRTDSAIAALTVRSVAPPHACESCGYVLLRAERYRCGFCGHVHARVR